MAVFAGSGGEIAQWDGSAWGCSAALNTLQVNIDQVQANVDAVERTGQAWRVSLGGGAVSRQLDADGLVMALGPWTQEWMNTCGHPSTASDERDPPLMRFMWRGGELN